MSEKEEDYLDTLLNSISEKEQADSQREEPESDSVQELSGKNPEEIAREAREKIEAENADREKEEAEKEARAEEEVKKLLEDTSIEEAAGATITSDDDSELSGSDMERLMNMRLDDLLDDVKADTDSISMEELLNQDDVKAAKTQEQAKTGKELPEKKSDKAEKDNSQGKDKKPDRAEQGDSQEKDENLDRAEKGDLQEKDEKPDGIENDDSQEKDEKSDGAEKDNSQGEEEKPEKSDKPEKKEKKKGVQVDESKVKPENPKKDSFFKKLKKVFFDSLEDESPEEKVKADGADASSEDKLKDKPKDKPEADAKEPKDENEQIIQDVFGNKDTLDDSDVPKKGFFARFKYRLAQMKAKRLEEEKAEEEAEKLEDEEKQKNKELKKAAAAEKKEKKKQAAQQKKAAKPKKEKQPKPKKEKKPKESPKPGDILKIKPLSLVMLVLFVAGAVVLINVMNSAAYYNTSSTLAKNYYNNGEYDKAYSKLNGIKLNSSDKTLYEQASTIMYVRRQYDSYENYMSLNMKTEALNALIKGIDRYNTFHATAQELGIEDKFMTEYQKVIDALQNTFKISEAQGISLADMSNSDFTNYYLKIKEYGKAVQ